MCVCVIITLLILLKEGTRILDTSLLSLAAIECLVSGFLGTRLIKEQRKASSKFKLNSLRMIHIPLKEYYLKINIRTLFIVTSNNIYVLSYTCKCCSSICVASDTKTLSSVSICDFRRNSQKVFAG